MTRWWRSAVLMIFFYTLPNVLMHAQCYGDAFLFSTDICSGTPKKHGRTSQWRHILSLSTSHSISFSPLALILSSFYSLFSSCFQFFPSLLLSLFLFSSFSPVSSSSSFPFLHFYFILSYQSKRESPFAKLLAYPVLVSQCPPGKERSERTSLTYVLATVFFLSVDLPIYLPTCFPFKYLFSS